LTAKCGVLCECFSSGVNCIYYGLKFSIFFDVAALWISGSSR
jgi:hypothetical protein